MADKSLSQFTYTALINANEWVDIADWLLHLPDRGYSTMRAAGPHCCGADW
jgi:hypothetical protein